MRFHPASLMLRTWAVVILLWLILPFQMESRTLTVYGFAILALFIGCFCVGTFLAARPMVQGPRNFDVRADFGLSDTIVKLAALATMALFAIDILGTGSFDLAAAYDERAGRADDLLQGAASTSSIAFQLGFLLYPASYVYLVREIGFRERPNIRNVLIFGLLPVLLATIAMGGRAPLFYALLLIAYGFRVHKQVFGESLINLPGMSGSSARTIWMRILLVVALLFATRYFIQVFFIRADTAGGAAGMFEVARDFWGVNFNGALSGPMFDILGEEYTYLIFIFSWYIVQGLVMSNVLFSEYDGPANLGIYGIDLGAALMRRIDGDFVADRFAALLQLNTYGFLPSAFGSLYVDVFFFGLLLCAIWGWLTGFVYRRVHEGQDSRYLLLAPFINLGIIFSMVNTPLGFSNGFVTHFWLLVVFFTTTKLVRVRPAQPAAAFATG